MLELWGNPCQFLKKIVYPKSISVSQVTLGYFRVTCTHTPCHIPISPFLCSFILISFRLCDASPFILFSLFRYPQPLSLCHSVTLVPVLCPLSPLHHFFPYPCLLTPCLSVPFYAYLPNIHSLLLASLFWLHLLYILSIVSLWAIFCILCTTLSLVVYKSFQLVVYSLACNCRPLLFIQSPPSLPLVTYQSLPWQYNPLVSPLLDSSKIKDNPVPQQGCNT